PRSKNEVALLSNQTDTSRASNDNLCFNILVEAGDIIVNQSKQTINDGKEKPKAKTYNSRYSLVVTHPTTNLPI
ncbi:hypothetical protein DL95DRAFT_339617, partial [Leptodontidium sp. 2 PMI_412]